MENVSNLSNSLCMGRLVMAQVILLVTILVMMWMWTGLVTVTVILLVTITRLAVMSVLAMTPERQF